ncbi:MAG: OmpA family protein [Fluviicola sp.]
MKLFLFVLALLTFPTIVCAKVELKSFYFKSNTSELQPDSWQELENLKQEMRHFKIQIIELNAFTENTQFNKNDKHLAQQRTKQTLQWLDSEDANLTINNFGNERIPLDFSPYNWERVDIYFVRFEKDLNETSGFISECQITKQNQSNITNLKSEQQAIQEKEINNNNMGQIKNLNLHLSFIEGKANICPSSEDNLQNLVEVLQNNPTVRANIRGHVCCGDNMRLSKNRAKKVYRSLIKAGIDRKRLDYEGLSNSEPLVTPELTSHDRRMNRRVEVIFDQSILVNPVVSDSETTAIAL